MKSERLETKTRKLLQLFKKLPPLMDKNSNTDASHRHLLEMTMASLNSLRQFWRRAVRPPLVMTALVPCSW